MFLTNSYLPNSELNKIESALKPLLDKKGVRYETVLKTIDQFSRFIDSCLLEYTTLVVTEMRQTFLEMSTNITTLRREIALVEVIKVIDPFGNSQTVLKVDATDCMGIARLIVQRYSYNPVFQRILESFVHAREFELKLDDQRRISSLKDADLASIERSSKVVMSVIVYQETVPDRRNARCPLCAKDIPYKQTRTDRAICKPPKADRPVGFDISMLRQLTIILAESGAFTSSSNDFGTKFNNSVQRIFGGIVRPVLLCWETNDPINGWYAEARLVKVDHTNVRFTQARAATRMKAREMAARSGYEEICAQFPEGL
ncbi:hypothetical protein H1R20_g15123, partial [Candolleomyces eurysporus]